jgi:hypothetical protein
VGWKHLEDDVERMGAENPFTALVWRLADGEDADNAYSSVPYEKVGLSASVGIGGVGVLIGGV